MTIHLESLTVRGFKSLATSQDVALGRYRVLKPNGQPGTDRDQSRRDVVSLLRLVALMFRSPTGLAEFAALSDGSARVFSPPAKPKDTPVIFLDLNFASDITDAECPRICYFAELIPGEGTSIRIRREGLRIGGREKEYRYGYGGSGSWFVDGGRSEGQEVTDWIGHLGQHGFQQQFPLAVAAASPILTSIDVMDLSDATPGSGLRQACPLPHGHLIDENGHGLPGVLYSLRTHDRPRYDAIVASIRSISPGFDDFLLEPQFGSVMLRWHERKAEGVLATLVSATEAPGGFLRLATYLTLLSLKPEHLPAVLVLDRPDIGIPRGAMPLIASLAARTAANGVQVVIIPDDPAPFLAVESQAMARQLDGATVSP